jgi:hypothetical protein
MECHNCKHQADVQAGMYADVPWDLSPCAACTFEERESTYTVEYDPEREGRVAAPVAGQHQEAYVPLSAVVSLLAMLWDMPEKTQTIIRGRMAKRTYAEIGRELGVSAARVEWLQQRAMTRWPALRAMFPAKAARAQRREAEMENNREELTENRGVYSEEQRDSSD